MIVESGSNVIQVRDDLRRIPAPYLLRKYDATVEDFDLIVDEDLRCEFLDGVLIVHSPASFEHEERISFLTILIGNFVAGRRLGRVSGSNTVLQFGDRRLCPDLSFLKTEHEDRIQEGVVVGPADLVIELLSQSTRDYDLREKRAAYRAGGVPEIWLLDLLRHEAHVDFVLRHTFARRVTMMARRLISHDRRIRNQRDPGPGRFASHPGSVPAAEV